MIQTIIFDFDGTILDSEFPIYRAWNEIFQAHNATLPMALWQQHIGTVSHDFDPCKILEEQIGRRLDREAVNKERRQRFLTLMEQETVKPGVVALIEEAQQAGLRLGVASSGTRDWVEDNLAKLNLRHHFQVVRTSADVQRVKPDPELYLSALAALEVEPRHALAIEDSRNGMLAAKRAGMRCLVVPNGMTHAMNFAEADWVVKSLQDFRVSHASSR